MKLIQFPEQTVIVAESQQDSYQPIPAHRRAEDPQGVLTFCWKLSWWERLKVLFGGKLWHQVLTFNEPLQPQWMQTGKPALGTEGFDYLPLRPYPWRNPKKAA